MIEIKEEIKERKEKTNKLQKERIWRWKDYQIFPSHFRPNLIFVSTGYKEGIVNNGKRKLEKAIKE